MVSSGCCKTAQKVDLDLTIPCFTSVARTEANGGLGGGAPPGDHLSEILFSRRTFWDLNVYIWRILRKKGAQKYGFISAKKNIPAEIIDLRHIYLIDIQ